MKKEFWEDEDIKCAKFIFKCYYNFVRCEQSSIPLAVLPPLVVWMVDMALWAESRWVSLCQTSVAKLNKINKFPLRINEKLHNLAILPLGMPKPPLFPESKFQVQLYSFSSPGLKVTELPL